MLFTGLCSSGLHCCVSVVSETAAWDVFVPSLVVWLLSLLFFRVKDAAAAGICTLCGGGGRGIRFQIFPLAAAGSGGLAAAGGGGGGGGGRFRIFLLAAAGSGALWVTASAGGGGGGFTGILIKGRRGSACTPILFPPRLLSWALG